MATVELRDIVTEADRAAAIALRRGLGQDEFVASVETSLAEAVLYPEACARYWTIYDPDRGEPVGFTMISDGIPEDVLVADPTLLGPYFLWRLLIDDRHQRRGYGTAALDAIADYVRHRPGARKLIVSTGQGEGSPQPFYERYGFVPTGQVHEGEVVLELDLTDPGPAVAELNTIVELRDIVTDADRAAALAVQVGPGQDVFVASVEQSLQDARNYAHAKPRSWTVNAGDDVVGFVMLSDGVAPEVVEGDPHMVSPYFLWRLLIDHRHQRRGYGTAALDALVEYLRSRPGADALYTSALPGEGSPQPFYEEYGFVPTGEVVDDEIVLRLDLTAPPTGAGTLGP